MCKCSARQQKVVGGAKSSSHAAGGGEGTRQLFMSSVVCCLYSARLVKETRPRLTTVVLKLDPVKQTGTGETMGEGYFFGPTAAFCVWMAWLVFGLGALGREGQAGEKMGGPSTEEPGEGPREWFSPNPAQRMESHRSHESHLHAWWPASWPARTFRVRVDSVVVRNMAQEMFATRPRPWASPASPRRRTGPKAVAGHWKTGTVPSDAAALRGGPIRRLGRPWHAAPVQVWLFPGSQNQRLPFLSLGDQHDSRLCRAPRARPRFRLRQNRS